MSLLASVLLCCGSDGNTLELLTKLNHSSVFIIRETLTDDVTSYLVPDELQPSQHRLSFTDIARAQTNSLTEFRNNLIAFNFMYYIIMIAMTMSYKVEAADGRGSEV